MIVFLFSLFLILHGLVHLLYLGQSLRRFELQPGMDWPAGSWFFSRLSGEGTTRALAGLLLALAAAGFAAGGVALFFRWAWWRPAVIASALLSTALYLLFWDGAWKDLDDQGAVAILINAAVTAAVLLLPWPV